MPRRRSPAGTSQSLSFSAVRRAARAEGRHYVASLVLAVLLTAGAIYLTLRGVELGAVQRAFASGDYMTLAPAVGLLALATYLRILRWQLLFSARTRPPFGPTAEVLLVGQFFNSVLPVRAGEAIRIFALHRRARTSRAETLATIVVARAFDVLVLLTLLFVALPWLPSIPWLTASLILALGVSLFVGGLVLALARYGSRPIRFVLRPLSRLPFLPLPRVDRGAVSLVRGLVALQDLRLAAASVALTLLSWILLSLSFWVVAVGFAPDLPLSAGILVAVAIGLALILPSGPAALGVFEAAVVTALSAYGVPRADALAAALVIHAVSVVPFLIAGVVVFFVWSHGVSRGHRVPPMSNGSSRRRNHPPPEQPDESSGRVRGRKARLRLQRR